jgi:hypothetical protein
MRFAVFLVFFAFTAAAHAANDGSSAAQTQAALAGSVVQCEAPVAIDNAAAVEAIAKAAETDAAEYAGRLADLPARAAESVAAIASAHSLDKAVVARAYIAAMCGRLKEKGVADAELHATLTRLARDLGARQTASGDGQAAAADKAAEGGITALIAPDAVKQAEASPIEAAKAPEKPEQSPVPATDQKAEAQGAPESGPAAADAADGAQREAEAKARAEAEAQREAASKAEAERDARRMAAERAAAEALAQRKTEEKTAAEPEAPGSNGTQPPADEKVAAAEEATENSAVRGMSAEPAEKSLIRPKKKMAKRKSRGSAVAALGEDECRALGVLQDCPDLNSVLDQLLEKPLEYNRPDKMMLGRKTEISLVLRTDWKGKNMPAEVSEEMKGLSGEVQKGISKITRVMSAELSGADFEVSPAGRQERTVILPQPVIWNWQVTPTETGNAKPLKLRLYAHLQGPGGTMPPVLVKTLDATITVDVTTWDWMVSQARALEPIYAVVAGILGLLTAIVTYFLTHRQAGAASAGGAEGITIRPSGPVLGDVGQSASDSKAPVHSAPLPPPAASESEAGDVPWKPKKPGSAEDEGGSAV